MQIPNRKALIRRTLIKRTPQLHRESYLYQLEQGASHRRTTCLCLAESGHLRPGTLKRKPGIASKGRLDSTQMFLEAL